MARQAKPLPRPGDLVLRLPPNSSSLAKNLSLSAGNGRLIAELGWQDGTYDNVRTELLEEGLVVLGRGRGGSVSLAGRKEFEVEPEVPLLAPTPKAKPAKANGNGGDLGFEAELFNLETAVEDLCEGGTRALSWA